jgi:RNA polymerase sigma-70 factor (ECF subfamily)
VDGPDEDEELVRRFVTDRHDPRPFEALVKRHQNFVLANCRVLSRSDADAEDLAQEVFVKAYFALPRFEQRARFRTWLRTIKVNHCMNYLRKRRGASFMDLDELETEHEAAVATAPDAEVAIESYDERTRILRVLDGMTDTLRVPLMLRDADGLSYEEIAGQLNVSLSAVKMRIKRGREQFRQRWIELETPAEPVARAS